MFVKIEGDPATPLVSIEEPDDCTRLHVSADDLDDSVAGSAVARAGLGSPGEPGHLWLDVTALRKRARAATAATDWDDRFDAMIAYARSKGWTDPTGELVAAHISRRGS